jgi:diguanylate cyclase (GGDEF)-like protein
MGWGRVNKSLRIVRIAGFFGIFKGTIASAAVPLLTLGVADSSFTSFQVGFFIILFALVIAILYAFAYRLQSKKLEIRERELGNELLDKTNQLEIVSQELQRVSTIDTLTEVANRKVFHEFLDREWRRGSRYHMPLSLIFVDIDYFKAYNENNGHQAGDECLKKIAAVLKQTAARGGDLVARYGEEEFGVILADTDNKSASYLAEEMRKKVQLLGLATSTTSTSSPVTISVGVATVFPSQDRNPQSFVALADKALTQAKNSGRNQIVNTNADTQGEV